MGKKGQFYLLTAIILSTVLWGSLPSKSHQTIFRTTFEALRENFVTESPQVINYAISSGENLTEVYQNFVERFLSYSAVKQVDFGVAYIIRTETTIEVGNYIGDELEVEVLGTVTTQGEDTVLQYQVADSLTLYLDDTPFHYSFTTEPVQFKALFRQLS